MSWALKGLAGPLKDKLFILKSGLTLGRQGDVLVPDTKSSSIHARITQASSGSWILADNSSKNGTRIDGERITSAQLTPGLSFFIGDQGFEVVETNDDLAREPRDMIEPDSLEETQPPQPLPVFPKSEISLDAPAEAAEVADEMPVDPLPEPEPEPVPKPKPTRYWHEILAEFAATNAENFSERKRPVSPLSPAIVLEFVRGLQVNSRWVLGYGPRKVGPSALDLPIWEPGAPAVCFEILPTSGGVMFKTSHPDFVRVNGEGVDSHVLRVGDKIQINETIIEVDFRE